MTARRGNKKIKKINRGKETRYQTPNSANLHFHLHLSTLVSKARKSQYGTNRHMYIKKIHRIITHQHEKQTESKKD
jgi:hypothetical protein